MTPMQLAQLRGPLTRAVSSSWRPTLALTPSLPELFARLRLDQPKGQIEGRRYASVKSQGHYKLKPKRTIPKKLGAKRTGDQYVIPGNIIYKQRGTIWHPGENTIMGRDHTIHAAVEGYVKYYRDPTLHPKRQYIGVTFKREDTLPYPPGLPRRRRLGLVAVPRRNEQLEEDLLGPSGIPRYVIRHEGEEIVVGAKSEEAAEEESPAVEVPVDGKAVDAADGAADAPHSRRKRSLNSIISGSRIRAAEQRRKGHRGTRVLRLQPDYSYRETNWEIGRLVGPAGKVGGTGKQGSRKSRFRARRRRRDAEFVVLGTKAAERAVRRKEHERRVAARRAIKDKELAELAAQEAAKKAAMKAEQERFASKT